MRNIFYHLLIFLLYIQRFVECKTVLGRSGSSSTMYEPRHITPDGVSSKPTYYAQNNFPTGTLLYSLTPKALGAQLRTGLIEGVIEGTNALSSFGQGLVTGLLGHDLNDYEDKSSSAIESQPTQNNNILNINNEISKSVTTTESSRSVIDDGSEIPPTSTPAASVLNSNAEATQSSKFVMVEIIQQLDPKSALPSYKIMVPLMEMVEADAENVPKECSITCFSISVNQSDLIYSKKVVPVEKIACYKVPVNFSVGENGKPNITKPSEQFSQETPVQIINKDAPAAPDQFVENAVKNVKHVNGKDCVCESEGQKDQKNTRSEKIDEAFSYLKKGLKILEELDLQEDICNWQYTDEFWQRFEQCYENPSNYTEQLGQQQSSQEISKVVLQQPEPEPVQQLSYQSTQQPITIKHITQKPSRAILAEGLEIKQSGTTKVIPISFWSTIATASYLSCSKFLIS